MGGSQSTRKVTVENENAIQVSQDALDRISAQLASKQAEPQPQQTQTAPPQPLPYYDSRRHQENAAEETYWVRRIEGLKRAHEKINSGMHIEYQKTLKEANELFNLVQQDKIASKPPCQDEKSKVLECYSSNPDKSLLCSVLVNQFNDCVCKSRIAAVTSS